jgi:hypothetical protein
VTQRRFTVVATVILAPGVGTPTAVFSIVNAALLRRCPITSRSGWWRSGPCSSRPAGRTSRPLVSHWLRSRSGDEPRSGSRRWAPSRTRRSQVQVGGQAFSPVTVLFDLQFLPTLGVPRADDRRPLAGEPLGEVRAHREFAQFEPRLERSSAACAFNWYGGHQHPHAAWTR